MPRVIELLPDIKVPSLVVVGADDTPFLAASDYMAAKIPGARKAVIPAAGHAVNIDQPQAFIDAVLPFLDGLPQHSAGKAVHHECLLAARPPDRRFPAAQLSRRQAQSLPPIGGPYAPPFTATLSNNTPLAFGMNAEDAARALGTPLNYISGRPGDEIYLDLPHSRRQRIVLRTVTGSFCSSGTAAWPAGRAIGATTGCGNSRRAAFPRNILQLDPT